MIKVVGRKPEPAGNIRPIRPKIDRSPSPPSQSPSPPTWLTADQRAIFRRVLVDMTAAQIEPLGIDVDLVASYSVAVDMVRQASEAIATDGLITEGRNGEGVRHPASIILAAQMRLVDSIAASLGVSPSSRQRMRAHSEPGRSDGYEYESPEEYFARA